MSLSKLIDTSLLQLFGERTIVPLKGAIGTLAEALEAMADAEIATENGAHGFRYYDGNLQYSTTAYSAVTPAGTENPKEQGWYVLVDGEYELTTDETVVAGTTYYSATITWHTIETGGGGGNGKCIPSVSTVSITDSEYTKTFSVDAYGTVVATSSNTDVCTVSVSATNDVTVQGGSSDGTATITLLSTGDSTHDAAVAYVTCNSTASGTYGVEWDGSSTQRWSRTGLSANFTDPVPAIGNGTGSSPFDDILPWSGIVKENRTGGVMVKIPKFYFKWTQSGSTLRLEISNKAKTGFSVSPAHMDRGDGVGERDYIYVGRYHCASDYKSKTGETPLGNKTRAEFRSGIHSLGSNIWQYDIMTHITIWMLYLVEFANWNSECIGYGCSDSGSVQNMGLTDAMQYHTGTSAANRTTYGHVQYRWIEDLWGNVFDWCDGIYFASEKIYVTLNPANASDTSGGTYVGDRATAGGYIKSMKVSSVMNWFLYPDDCAGASEDTYVGDYCSYDASGVVLFVGGYYGQNRNRGLFCLYGNSAASNKNVSIGSRLLELPAA